MSEEWVDADPWEDAQPPLAQLAPGAAQPIGDAPPDFGDARVQPGETDAALPRVGKGLLDAAATTASRLIPVGAVAGGAYGLITGLGNSAIDAFGGTTDKTAADAVNDLSSALTWEPRTETGKLAAHAVELPFEKLAKGGHYVGEKVQDLTGSDILATAADTAVQALPMLLGADKAGKALEHPKLPEGMDTAKANAIPLEVPRESKNLPFTPEERHAARLDTLLTQLGDITPEQKQAITEHHGDVQRDPVMNLPERRDLVPSIEAAKEQGGGSYGEFDIRGVGNINSHLGSNSAADPHLRAVAEIVKRNLDEAAQASGGDVVLTRKGGDELGAIAKGVDAPDLHAAGLKAQAEVDAYAKEHGLDQAPQTKNEGGPGFGLHFGVSDISPDRHVSDIISDADRQVELRKKGKVGYEYQGPTAPAGLEPLGEQPGSAGRGADAAVPERPGRGTAAPADERQPGGSVDEPGILPAAVSETARASDRPADTGVADGDAAEVSARNAAIDADRGARDLEALPPAERQAWAEPHAEALARIAKEPDYPQTLAREVSAKPRAITATETMALTHDLRRLTTEHEAATKAVLEARSAKDPVAEAQALARVGNATEALTRNHEAIRKGGTEAARSLSIRNAIVKDDYTIGRNLDRAKVAFGDKFNDAIKKHVEDLSERLKSVEAELARKEANKPAPDLKVERKSPDERMQAQLERKMSKLQEAIDKRTKACPL